jgi:hypothetical protein
MSGHSSTPICVAGGNLFFQLYVSKKCSTVSDSYTGFRHNTKLFSDWMELGLIFIDGHPLNLSCSLYLFFLSSKYNPLGRGRCSQRLN